MTPRILMRALGATRNLAVTTNQQLRLHTKSPQQLVAQDLSSVQDHAVQVMASQLPKVVSGPSPPSSSSTSHLSFWALLQTYVMTACTSSPLIIGPSIRILSTIASSKSALLSPDRNRVLHWLLKHTVYRQFCAGENAAEVQSTIARLQGTGINGVILCYAREVELRSTNSAAAIAEQESEAIARKEIESWAEGVLKTIRIVPEGNFVSVKFSGAGSLTLQHLKNNLAPPPLLAERLHQICTLAYSRRTKICIDAEQSAFQAGIDKWTLDLQREFNSLARSSSPAGKPWACIFNTYQTYLRSAPATLSSHLALASQESFILGVKLVRGAYLASEPRALFWPTKEGTDACFDALAHGLISRDWNVMSIATTPPANATEAKSAAPPAPFPETSLVLATHNLSSTRKALALGRHLAEQPRPEEAHRTELFYAQLQGMADHVTGELVSAARQASAVGALSSPSSSSSALPLAQAQAQASPSSSSSSSSSSSPPPPPLPPQVFKYLTWGSVSECAGYLVRRAEENRDAVARTVDARRVLGTEVLRRVRAWMGFQG